MSRLSQRIGSLSLQPPNTAQVPFGEWLPDLPSHINPGAITALNVFPKTASYGPVGDLLSQSTNSIDGTAQGAISVKDNAGAAFTYVGDETKLYEIGSSRAFTDESKVGNYTAAADPVWEFALFDQTVCATNYTDPVQAISAGGGTGSAFADLIVSTLTPKAKRMGVIRNFLVLGNTVDATSGAKNNRLWWSGFDDITDFDPDAATQSSFRNLPFGGTVQKIVGGVEYGVVFQDTAIRRMTYVGSPTVFRIDAVDRRRGTQFPNSVCGHGRLIFFLSEEGFFVFDGTTSHPIGDGKVDRTFFRQFDSSNRAKLSCAIDLENKLYIVGFPSGSSSFPDKIFAYYWPGGKWSEIELQQDIIFSSLVPPTSIDSLAGNVDTDYTLSFDSSIYQGGKSKIASIDTSGFLSFLDGPNLTARIDTGEKQFGQRATVNSLRPRVDGANITCQVASRTRLQDTVDFGSSAALDSNGECSLRSSGMYHRVRTEISGEWTHAEGVDIDYAQTGER